MNLGNRVVRRTEFTFDYYLKEYLHRPSEESVKLLAMLAMDDIGYCKNIVNVIGYRCFKVDDASKLYIIYLIDTIVQTVGSEPYRKLFSEKLPQLFAEVLRIATVKVRDILCKTRQTWNGVFPTEVLREIDTHIRGIVTGERELELLQMEINLLEHRLNSPKISDSKKRLRTEVDEKLPKKRNVAQSDENASVNSEFERNFLSPQSSVLLTPSPEPEEMFDANSFWTNVNKTDERKSNSPVLIEQNGSLPFFNDSIANEAPVEVDAVGAVGIEKEVQSTVDTNEEPNNEEAKNEEPKNEEPTTADELMIIEPDVPFIDLDDYIETQDTNLIAIVKEEPKRPGYGDDEEDDEKDDDDEGNEEELTSENICVPSNSYRRTPPLVINLDGEIVPQQVSPPTASKQIKFNLINPRFIQDSKAVSDKSPEQTATEQTKHKKPSEWERPSISFERKESMKNVQFQERPIHRRGLETSAMCSIM